MGFLKGPALTEDATHTSPPTAAPIPHYDRSALSYAGSFDSATKRGIIRTIEFLTGKITILRLAQRFEREGIPQGQEVFTRILRTMSIALETPESELAHIPKTGPVVLVANHPHGLIDGVVLAELIGRVRRDYRILTRSLLTGLDQEATSFMIPVPFPHQSDAQERMVEMRGQAMSYLGEGGLIALFPSGTVAASQTLLGPGIEAPWNAFTAKMIRKSGATVVPIFFEGSNSRAYHMANRISATVRQGLLIHEIARAVGKPIAPVIGRPFPKDEIDARIGDTRAFMAWLRETTLDLRR